MDVHTPKGPIHGWRAFIGEVGIIVLGVLIALGAEQAVQGLEWSQKVRAARAAMISELRDDDGPQVLQRAMMHPCVTAKLHALREAVETGASREAVSRLADEYRIQFLTFDSLAESNAMASGVAAHMDASELERFTAVYGVMPMLDRVNGREAQDIGKLRALRRTGGPLSDAEKDRMLEAVETLRGDEAAMWSGVMWSLPRIERLGGLRHSAREKSLLAWARSAYGDCIRDLPPNWRDQP